MKKNVLLLLGSFALLSSAPAFADAALPSEIYIEGNIGYSHINEKVINSGNNNNDGIGWNINAGYFLNSNWAVEGGFTSHTDETFGGGIVPTTGKDNYVIDAAIKGVYSWSNNINFFAKLGPAWVHHKLNNAGTSTGARDRAALYGGVGGLVTMSSHFALTVQVNGSSKVGQMPAMVLTSVGLTVFV